MWVSVTVIIWISVTAVIWVSVTAVMWVSVTAVMWVSVTAVMWVSVTASIWVSVTAVIWVSVTAIIWVIVIDGNSSCSPLMINANVLISTSHYYLFLFVDVRLFVCFVCSFVFLFVCFFSHDCCICSAIFESSSKKEVAAALRSDLSTFSKQLVPSLILNFENWHCSLTVGIPIGAFPRKIQENTWRRVS